MPVNQARLLEHDIAPVLKTVERRAIAFFHDQLDLVAEKIGHSIHREDQFTLREMTAIVGVGSSQGLYIAFSYDLPLVKAMTRKYTAELTIAPEEEDLYMRETALDVVNVIIGNCTADLARQREVIALSPPVLALGARTMQGRPKSAVAVMALTFPEGALDIAFVGPKLLFDEHLNYIGENV